MLAIAGLQFNFEISTFIDCCAVDTNFGSPALTKNGLPNNKPIL
jgi:hypothetical protein